jgi:hypothetical protein
MYICIIQNKPESESKHDFSKEDMNRSREGFYPGSDVRNKLTVVVRTTTFKLLAITRLSNRRGSSILDKIT